MEMDFWGSRHHHFHAVQSGRLNNSDNHLVMDTMEGDEDVRAWFPCPFCYVEIEVPVLCTHLQEEHCFDLRNAVCPICAANLGKDAITHFTSHHAHSVKRRRKSHKSGQWSSGTSLTREMSSLINPSRGNTQETAPDPLSAFLCNVPPSQKLSSDAGTATSDTKSSKSRTSNEEEDSEERRHRTAFVQQIVFSTIF